MKRIYITTLVALVALAGALVVAPTALAVEQPFASVMVAGDVWFEHDGSAAFAAFQARAIGPATAAGEHQPAQGILKYRDTEGLTYQVAVEHIHALEDNEVHFGGTIVKSSDHTFVGLHAHVVAVDSGSRGDMFSILVTGSETHTHADPLAVLRGNLVLKVR